MGSGAWWRRLLNHRLVVLGGVLFVVLLAACWLAPYLTPYEPNPTLNAAVLADARQPPSAEHWLGTDQLGRDELTRMLYAGRLSLTVGLSVAALSTLIGTAIGGIAGYAGGWVDGVLMRITDLFLLMPGLALLMVAQRGLGGSLAAMVVILSALLWVPPARVVRATVASLRHEEFVEAARAVGATGPRVLLRHLLPNALAPILVNATLAVGAAIRTESALSFLGFGLQPPAVSWGLMVAQGRAYVGTPLAYLVYFPGLAILLIILALTLLSDGLRDVLDPRSSPHSARGTERAGAAARAGDEERDRPARLAV